MKPNFRDKWRKPKGKHSKVRLSKKGNVGLIRGGMSKGKKGERKVVHNIKELRSSKEVIIARIGLKKKIELLKEAERTGIKILNIKDPREFLKRVEEEMIIRKEEKKEKSEEDKKKKSKEKTEEKLDEKLKVDKGGQK